MHLGERIRHLRKAKKMTLVDLSNVTDVAQASLSRIETGIMKGTVESHRKIAEALGMTIAELYAGIDSKLEEIELKRSADTQKEAVVKDSNVRLELLTAQLNIRKFAPVLITLPAQTSINFQKLERDTDKFFWVQTGSVTVKLSDKVYHLNANDSLYFDASYTHQLQNTGSIEARVFSITSPATF